VRVALTVEHAGSDERVGDGHFVGEFLEGE
jgi:hypothetical protein